MAEYFYDTHHKGNQRFIHKAAGPSGFDKLYSPGDDAPRSGIYRCENCGQEAVSTKGHSLPPQGHKEHPKSCGKILWRLIVGTSDN